MRTPVIVLLKMYKLLISPFLGQNCRFHPSCASYTIEAVDRHGVMRGLFLGLRRVIKCQPWHGGGYDPVPEAANCDPHRACNHYGASATPTDKDYLPDYSSLGEINPGNVR